MNFLSKGVYRFSYFAVLSIEMAREMAAIFFLHDDHLAKEVLSGMPSLDPCNMTERSSTT